MFCTDILQPIYLIISDQVPALLYYSHVPAIIVSLIIGLFVYFKNKESLSGKLLLSLSIVFSIWAFINLILWTNVDSRIIIFYWSLLAIIFTGISFLSFYFLYSFITKKDLPFRFKLIWAILALPVLVFSPTKIYIPSFDLVYCNPTELPIFTYYFLSLGFIALFWSLSIAYLYYRKAERLFKSEILYLSIGITLFLISFFSTSSLGLYLIDIGLIVDFDMEFYGLFGMLIFLAFIAFLIVRYKAFNIKLLGAQALVIALLILIGSQFLYANSDMNKLLIAITLIASCSIGLILIRSVRKVDQQKELLNIANHEQENLIHFISHQIKGFFTKSRNIFSTMNDEKDSIPSGLHNFIDEGIRSDNEGIKVVTDILNAANLKTGKIQFNKNKFYLNLLVENIIENNKILADKKGIALKYNSPGKIIEFNGDEARLKDAIGNIINNSINYTVTGEVKVDLIQTPKQIKIVVIDTGVGLTDSDKAKLFNSGSRGSDSLKYNVNSTGYGLYIAKRVVEGHSGTIIAESAGRDKGSTFTITLPI